jgi:hypothetical protein
MPAQTGNCHVGHLLNAFSVGKKARADTLSFPNVYYDCCKLGHIIEMLEVCCI